MIPLFLEIIRNADIQQFEYQIRYIDGPVFYKRKKGESIWTFTTAEDFSKNVNKDNLINYYAKENY